MYYNSTETKSIIGKDHQDEHWIPRDEGENRATAERSPEDNRRTIQADRNTTGTFGAPNKPLQQQEVIICEVPDTSTRNLGTSVGK